MSTNEHETDFMATSQFRYTCDTTAVPSDITHIHVDEAVKELDDNAFKELFDLLTVELPPTLQRMGSMVCYCCTNLTTINLPPLLKEIPEDAFQSCRSLQDFALPPKLEVIGERAFFECESITELHCPPTLKVIGKGAFVHCRSLVTVNLPDTLEHLGNRCFVDCESLETFSVPSGISKIQRGTFSHCHSLTKVEMKEGLEVIGVGAFWCCGSLGRVRIPSTVYLIESSAFRFCSSLESAELSYGLARLEEMVFDMCDNLLNVAFPPSLSCASKDVFQGCDKLAALFSSEPKELFPRLRERFDNLSIHRICYDHQSPMTKDCIDGGDYDTIEASDVKRTDSFGMLPYHILALSTKLNVQLFSKLLKHHNSSELALVNEPDKFGNCPMDYICGSNGADTIHNIRDILKLAMEHRIEGFGLDRWKKDVLQDIEDIVYGDVPSARRKRIHKIYRKLLATERLEAISLMDLAVWKAEINKSSTNIIDGPLNEEGRKACHIKSGVEIIIPNVTAFLSDAIDGLHFKSNE